MSSLTNQSAVLPSRDSDLTNQKPVLQSRDKDLTNQSQRPAMTGAIVDVNMTNGPLTLTVNQLPALHNNHLKQQLY